MSLYKVVEITASGHPFIAKPFTPDRAEALGRGLLQSALETHGPAQEGGRLRRGVNRDGALVVLDGPVELPLPPEFSGPSQVF
jgi:hypothetical protein